MGAVVENGGRRPGIARLDLDAPLWTVKEVAELLSVRQAWVYTAAREGLLPYVKVGRHLRFIQADIERWILENRNR